MAVAVPQCLSACCCFLAFILGLTVGQETTPLKPIILNNPPVMTLPPPENPPVMTPPGAEEAVPVLRKEDLGGIENVNPTHVNGEELFEADILLSPEQKKQLLERKAIAFLSMRWPNGPNGTPVVPYLFADTAVNATQVEAGLAHWKENTCIDFQLITGTPPAKYLKFFKGTGCWSYVGMQSTPQDISIGDGCTSLGTVAHEVGHAIGFFHEQSRSDRDDYVIILLENVQAGKENNFDKAADNNYSVQYDFSSDMHYGSDYFSVNGKNTMVTKNPLAQELIGSNKGLSHYDKLLANTMYPCITKWMQNCSIATNPCLNDGYVGKNCSCVCRSGTSGANCETVNQSYYDSLISGCSSNVTAPGTITSPNYPSNYPTGLKCVKWIQAPQCTTVKIKFGAFRLYGRNPYCNGTSCCYFDNLEIRTTNLTIGEIYCDQDIAVGTEFTSPSNQMILVFKTRTNYYSGWTANVTFEAVPSCTPNTTLTNTSTSTPTTTSTSTSTSTPTTTSTSTSTSTPTTTRTSTSTSTPTTTRTTSTCTSTSTSTSTPTTTRTSTSTSTPTTTRTSTTTPPVMDPPADACNVVQLSPTQIQWTSPNFGLGNYPNNESCLLSLSSSSPAWAEVQLLQFSLHKTDYVLFPNMLGPPLALTNSQTGVWNLPSVNVMAQFYNSATRNGVGFKMTITSKTSNCHQLINTADVGNTGTIAAPPQPNLIWVKKGCEFWIRSPEGTNIQLTFNSMVMTRKCAENSVIVNPDGDVTYPPNSSSRFCGTTLPPSITSTANEMNVFFFSTRDTKLFSATWSVVASK